MKEIIESMRTWGFGWEFLVIALFMLCAYLYVNRHYKRNKSRNFRNALPGIYTSLGLLGTFFSIWISLSNISTIENIDIAEIIRGLVPAFTTSIAGLILALFATMRNKKIYGDEDHAYEQLHTDPNVLLQNSVNALQNIQINTEQVPDALGAVNTKLQEQKTAQESFNKKLDSILAAFNKQEESNKELNKQLNDNMAKQTEALQLFITNFVNRMDEIFKQMQISINQQVQTFGTEQFEKTSKVLEEITKQMSEVSTKLISHQVEAMKTMASSTTTQLETFNTAQQEKFKALLEAQSKQVEAIGTQNAESLQQMVDLKEAYAETSKKLIDDNQAKNKELCDFVSNSMSDLVTNIDDKVRKQCETLTTSITNCVELLQESYTFIDSKIAQIKSDYEQSTLAYKDAVQNAHDINDSFEKTIVQVDNSIKSLIKTNEGVDNVLALLNERQTNIELLVQKIQEVSAAIVVLQQLEIQLNKLSNK